MLELMVKGLSNEWKKSVQDPKSEIFSDSFRFLAVTENGNNISLLEIFLRFLLTICRCSKDQKSEKYSVKDSDDRWSDKSLVRISELWLLLSIENEV